MLAGKERPAGKDKPVAEQADKPQEKAEAKEPQTGQRELNRQELETLRRQLQKKFHRS